MALGDNYIDMTLIGNTIGSSKRYEGGLNIEPTINPWSKARPGYWTSATVDGKAAMAFHVPDGVSTDPRGANPDTNDALEHFAMGDFRDYDHAAIAPHSPTNSTPDNPVNYNSADFGTVQTITVSIYPEQFNFVNTGVYRTLNNLPVVDTFYLVDPNDGTVKGSVAIPTSGEVGIPYSFTVPGTQNDGGSGGVTETFTYEIWAGTAPVANVNNQLYALVDDNGILTGSFTIHTFKDSTCSVIVVDSDGDGTADFDTDTLSASITYGQTALDWQIEPTDANQNGVGLNTNCYAEIVKGTDTTVIASTGTIVLKDGTLQTGTVTLPAAVGYDENYHMYWHIGTDPN